MKTSILAAAAFALVNVSTVAFAAPQSELTREKVVAELKALQDVGYQGATDHTRYPTNLLAAKAELAKREHAPDAAREASNPAMAPTQATTGVATGDAMPAPTSGMAGMSSGMKRAAYGGTSLHERIYRGQ
ncbi:hypothetical protein PAN31117_01085 [Pandoraea anapnoica]|uniref:DUF4148 domain-containing protein n=1 Tax=Pandoraea anapnoica TaxID=2508301 RepID=A0A5E4ZNJ6_9BURK|nr:DUF4148 domain-containing protein [Pandoraea anapnoica]VVE62931.1 hypothetical protein PAN31117_01085 [Pandoraea anapnoica]